MTALHAATSNSLLLLLLVCLGWSAFALVGGRGVTPALRGTFLVATAVAVAQLVIGGLLVATAGRPLNPIHALYGISTIVALAGALIYGGRTTPAREALIFALVALFSAGLVLRAVETAAHLG